MNGREISNSVTTARTLAADAGVRLGVRHLEVIVGVWADFHMSLRRVQRRVSGREAKISGSFDWKENKDGDDDDDDDDEGID